MSLGGSPHEDGENELAMNAATQVRTFKYVAMAVLLLITIVSALVPLWISSHGTATSRNALRSKLPFVTAGVFLGSGLMHLLPDASEMYTQMLERMDSLDQTPWLVEFPLVHLLCCLGCTIVWSVDLLNLGDSGKMMAVATAARPNCGTSMCRVQFSPVAFYGEHGRSYSVDALKHGSDGNLASCSDGHLNALPAHTTLGERSRSVDERSVLLLQHGIKVMTPMNVRTYSFERPDGGLLIPHPSHADCHLDDEHEHGRQDQHSVSEHVVFSGENALVPYLLAALFSIHSLIAGFALGVSHSLNKTAIATTVAIFSHKFIEAIAVGANFARAKDNISLHRSIAVLTMYSFMTPLGIFLGMVATAALQGVQAFALQACALGIASGSFIYLAFHELSEDHAGEEASSVAKLGLFFFGMGSMAALAAWT